jgi:hypothetical protein
VWSSVTVVNSLSHYEFRREGSLHEERKRVSELRTTKENACCPFVSELKCFLPRSQKIDVQKRMKWRKQFEEALPDDLKGKSKFPFAIYQDNSKLPELNFFDAVRALVLRNSGIIKKRYPCMPSIVIAATPSSPEHVDDVQSCIHKCYFGINPLSCVWFLSGRVDLGIDSNSQNKPARFSVCDTILFYVIDDLISGKDKNWKKFQDRVKPNYHHDHAAVDFVKSVLNASEHKSVIHALSQAKSVVLVNNSTSETSKKEAAFISICQMIRNMKFFDESAAFKHRSDSGKLPRVFVVPDASSARRPDYVQAFRTGAHLLLARGKKAFPETFDELRSSIQNSGINHSLPTFYFFFQSVSLTLRSIELFFRYFLHHMAFVKRSRVPDNKNFEFFLHNQKYNIAERIQRLKKAFSFALEHTYIFHRPGNKELDWDHLCFMFQCLSLLQTDCMLSSNKDIKGMWTIFSESFQTEQMKKTAKKYFQSFKEVLKSFGEKIENPEKHWKNEKELANAIFGELLHIFSFHWTEPFCPDSATATDKNFFNPAHEIAEICESSKFFLIPLLQPEYMAFGFSRIAIDSHLSASMRFLGETALMSAACAGNLQRVKLLMEGSSLSQIMSLSKHPEAEDLDALFMCLFYAQVHAAKLIVQGMMKEFSDELSKIDRNPLKCQHKVLGCTTFMLACRYGDKELLDAMFELLDKYTLDHTFKTKDQSQRPDLSISDYQDFKRNRVLMQEDRNGANALHHAIIAANFEAVKWLKEKRAAFKTQTWYSGLSDQDKQSLKCLRDVNVHVRIPDLDDPVNQYGFWFDPENANDAQEEIWKKRPSVFQSGHVAEDASSNVLSPAFALIYLMPESNDRSFLNRALHDDYNLLFQSLYRVDSHIMCQVENDVAFSTTKETNFESLQEYELAVMMWRWCDCHPFKQKLSTIPEYDWNILLDLVQTCPKEDIDSMIDLAHCLRKRCKISRIQVDRQQELDRYEENDVKDDEAIKEESETTVREEIALELTEFSKEESDESPWFKV